MPKKNLGAVKSALAQMHGSGVPVVLVVLFMVVVVVMVVVMVP